MSTKNGDFDFRGVGLKPFLLLSLLVCDNITCMWEWIKHLSSYFKLILSYEDTPKIEEEQEHMPVG